MYILKRLAYVCFLNRKYAEAEKYFQVAAEMVPRVTKNPVNIFNAQKNLLLFYTHTDIDKAETYGDRMLKDVDEYLPVHYKQICFMLANVHFLKGDHQGAKNLYRNVLKLAPKPVLEAKVLNNLAFTSWMHVLDLKSDKEVDEESKKLILKDESYV